MFTQKGQKLKIKNKELLKKDPSVYENFDGSFQSLSNGRIMNKLMQNYAYVIAPETANSKQFYYDGWIWEEWMFETNLKNPTIMDTE